jgi:hypothetical protein
MTIADDCREFYESGRTPSSGKSSGFGTVVVRGKAAALMLRGCRQKCLSCEQIVESSTNPAIATLVPLWNAKPTCIMGFPVCPTHAALSDEEIAGASGCCAGTASIWRR